MLTTTTTRLWSIEGLVSWDMLAFHSSSVLQSLSVPLNLTIFIYHIICSLQEFGHERWLALTIFVYLLKAVGSGWRGGIEQFFRRIYIIAKYSEGSRHFVMASYIAFHMAFFEAFK